VNKFDRIISIEMFEHMKNYELLLHKISNNFLKSNGLLFVHIFVAHHFPYHFVARENDPASWMAEHFFSGGTMPKDDTLTSFQKDVHLLDQWRVNGKHYSLTLEAWLQKMDKNLDQVQTLFKEIYGEKNVILWTARWRAFFFVCSELFKFNDGHEWYVAHYLFENRN
jgi:cyclopropane-fatty-acyl-phospholipid synthase